ncbi:GntR family transcriptional regulator [Mycoplasma sp. P36-A1]|uniref:GntR family transcriptional regulator n=1 Tax=Mycoplasma sp. P36-A1 TaxID=3252900 RepID=UPI003C2F48FF
MNFIFNGVEPIFIQIANQLEDSIATGFFKEGDQIPSTTEISKQFKINPATVLKGINILVNKEIIEKKRGIGMFVKNGAYQKLKEERKEIFLNTELDKVVEDAKNLDISLSQLLSDIERRYK